MYGTMRITIVMAMESNKPPADVALSQHLYTNKEIA